MQVQIDQSLTLKLSLSKEEAEWLNGVMQNPLHGQHPDDEDPQDAEMRYTFFSATKIVTPPI